MLSGTTIYGVLSVIQDPKCHSSKLNMMIYHASWTLADWIFILHYNVFKNSIRNFCFGPILVFLRFSNNYGKFTPLLPVFSNAFLTALEKSCPWHNRIIWPGHATQTSFPREPKAGAGQSPTHMAEKETFTIVQRRRRHTCTSPLDVNRQAKRSMCLWQDIQPYKGRDFWPVLPGRWALSTRC